MTATRTALGWLGICAALAVGQATNAKDAPPPSLAELMALKTPEISPVDDMRATMIRTAGRTVGYRAAVANRGMGYRDLLDKRAPVLDQLFQFQTVMGPGGVLPPVIVESKDVASYSDDQLRTSPQVYRIVRGEKIVSVPPTWRDYLLVGLGGKVKIDLPQDDARPKSGAEMKVWQDAVQEGWKQGSEEADAIFTANLNRLARDFNGMLRYSILLQQGIITPTQVAESRRAVSGDSMEIMIDDRLRRITKKAELSVDPKAWRMGSPARELAKPAPSTMKKEATQ